MAFDVDEIRIAQRHLRKRDPVMRRLIDAVGSFTLRVERDRFRMLVLLAKPRTVTAISDIRYLLSLPKSPHANENGRHAY